MNLRHCLCCLFGLLAVLLLAAPPAPAQAPVHPCAIVARYPHNPETSTQGLYFKNNLLYESSGGYGKSFLAIVELETGRHLRTRDIARQYFAEGIAPRAGTIHMLTWKSGKGFIHAEGTLAPLGQFPIRPGNETTQGWGLTVYDNQFVASSGSPWITFHDPVTFARVHAILVQDNNVPIDQLNELETVGNRLFANIWKSDRIAVIDPQTGLVTAWIDLSPLRQHLAPESGVANGIAYDPKTRRLFVTGKHWDQLFEITTAHPLW